MAESNTYLNYVFSNNALVIDYYQTGKGERDESRDWEVHVCSLGVGDEAPSIVNATCVEDKQAVASESAVRGKDSINHIPWYDM